MNRHWRKIPIIAAVVIAFLAGADAEGAEYSPIQTGYDLITKLAAVDRNPSDYDGLLLKTAESMEARGHLNGVVAGFVFMEIMSPLPEFRGAFDQAGDMQLGQIIMIYQKWARDNPELLNLPAAMCVFMALFPENGQKK